MPLEPGASLGPYQVTAKIGEGGMGEVCRARDTKLDRDVALKVLPEAFTADPERLARFEREAKVLASLNHPNIAQIHGIEEAEPSPPQDVGRAFSPATVKALVLELVEGPTLADRIAEGPIPSDEALPIAKQIAEALEAAHEQGIIHRDLKPANVRSSSRIGSKNSRRASRAPEGSFSRNASSVAPGRVTGCRRRVVPTVYAVYIMRRTQIYLTEEQGRLLESRARATGSTISELIRAAIDSAYCRRRGLSRAQKVRLARRAAGSWREFPETGAEYVERIRGSGRLVRLHGRD